MLEKLFSKCLKVNFLIVSNPPQLPMKNGSYHDGGGKKSRNVIDEIIKRSSKYLNQKGSIILLVFDFLSVNKQLERYYPKYKFSRDKSGNLFYKMLVVRGTKD